MKESFETPEKNYLDVFHLAQARLAGGDIEGGRELLLQASELAGASDEVQDFDEYIKGTQAYVDKNVDLLKEATASVQQPENKAILQRFLASLEAGEEIDYDRVYRNLE